MPRACEVVDHLPQMTIVLDGDQQVGGELACAQSLKMHALLAEKHSSFGTCLFRGC